ncbi:MAG: hypothetical protein ACXVW4_15465 [Nocardioides sp.]
MTGTQDWAALLQQLRRGSWTNDPSDPHYARHWKVADSGGEAISRSMPGVAVRSTPAGRVKQQVNIRLTDQHVYLDTPAVSAVGPVARLAGRGLGAAGLSNPMVAPRPPGLRLDGPFTVTTAQGDLVVRPNPAAHVGRPADLAPRAQVANLWHVLRGK